jgi:hypothetical protein
MSQNPPTLKERLSNLLAERKQLRELVQKGIIYRLRFDRERTAAAEQSISELVNGPLSLESYELPSAANLATACEKLPGLFTEPHLIENPKLLWNGFISIVPGVMSSNWHERLQTRLIALCGPLDQPLAEMLATEAV